MPLSLDAPLRTAEFLVVDTETNGRAGDACEVTEIGAVLVGGGELHDRWETLVAVRAPLSRGIQRFTGITQDMVDEAPPADTTLPELAALMQGRVMVAHSAAFDRGVLRQAFARAGVQWPDPPVLCTVALARRLAPLVRQRKLAALADSLGVPVETTHRALADAETCARILCALFGRLCSHATTVGDALELVAPRRRRAAPVSRRTDGGTTLAGVRRRVPDVSALPDAPGVYIFRNEAGQPLYVGKSVRLRARARSHFAPSSNDGDWTTQVECVDHVETASELGALLEEHRLIRLLRPPGNVRGKHTDDRHVFLRCRLDIEYPILEVAGEPASGTAVNVGPLRGRHNAIELMEQLNSLFSLRHCGRKLHVRQWPSAYGQMGRCLSPCLGDLDPNAYRRRLDDALSLFQTGDGAEALLDEIDRRVREASEARAYERAAWLRRRRARLVVLLDRLGGTMVATHSRPRLLVAPGLVRPGADVVWLLGGRVAAWRTLATDEPAALAAELSLQTASLLATTPTGAGRPVHLTADEAALARIVTTWEESNAPPSLPLHPAPADADFRRLGRDGVSQMAAA